MYQPIVDERICVQPVHTPKSDLVGYKRTPVYHAPYCLQLDDPEAEYYEEDYAREKGKAKDIGPYARRIWDGNFDRGGLTIQTCWLIGWHCEGKGDTSQWIFNRQVLTSSRATSMIVGAALARKPLLSSSRMVVVQAVELCRVGRYTPASTMLTGDCNRAGVSATRVNPGRDGRWIELNCDNETMGRGSMRQFWRSLAWLGDLRNLWRSWRPGRLCLAHPDAPI